LKRRWRRIGEGRASNREQDETAETLRAFRVSAPIPEVYPMTTWRRLLALSMFALAALAAASPAVAAEERFELGLRLGAVAADGEPTNDIMGGGVYGRYRLSDRWRLGVAVDHSPDFDVERPYEFLGLVGDPAAGEVDAAGTSSNVLAWIERAYPRPGGRLEWFWGVGGGVGFVDVEPVAGALADGGRYDIAEEVGTELLAIATAGLRVRLGSAWSLEAALRAEQHHTDWKVTDRRSGRSVSLDDYLTTGGHFAIAYRF
jgi:hypothetical protein